jgi:hypothetical protein
MFHRVLFGSITKTELTEEQVRSELTGYYEDIDATIHDMIHDPRTPVKKNNIAVYWYGR